MAENETKKPALFKRGEDDINLDELKNNSRFTLNYELDRSSLTEEEKKAVRSRFNELLLGMYDNKVTYTINDENKANFNNTIGLNNSDKMSQYAAYILGKSIRDAEVYIPPVETLDQYKVDYGGSSTIANLLYQRLFNDGDIDLDAFTNLDYDENSKRITGNTKRSEKLISELQYILSNYDFGDKTEQAYKDINSAIQLLSNGVTKNEYFDLGRILGISGIGDWFGNIYTPVTPDGTITPETIEEYKASKYPRVASPLIEDMDLTYLPNYGNHGAKLKAYLQKQADDWLLTNINFIFDHNPQNFYAYQPIKAYTNENSIAQFSNSYLLREMLEILRLRNSSSKYKDTTGNRMYINGSYSKKKGTVLVYEISADGSKKIKEINIYDIPEFNSFIEEQMKSEIPSNKKGGILKFNLGGEFDAFLLNGRGADYQYIYDTDRLINPLNFGQAWETKKLGNNSGTYVPLKIDKQDVRAIQEKNYYKDFFNSLFNDDHTPNELGQTYLKAIDEKLPESLKFYDNNGELKKSWTKTLDGGKKTKTYNSAYDRLTDNSTDDLAGAQHNIFGRTAERFFTINGQELDPAQKKYYVYNENPFNITDGPEGILYKNYVVTDIVSQLNTATTAQEPIPEQTRAKDETTDTSPSTDVTDAGGTDAGGTDEDVTGDKLPFTIPEVKEEFFGKFADYLMDLSRIPLAMSNIHANNRASKIIDSSLKAPLSTTFEKYVPVTGDFNAMQFKSLQAANTMFQAKEHNATSDASLASAQMLEALRLAKNQEAEGFLMNDQAWKQNRDQALQAQWDNMMRRTLTNNENMKLINLNNKEKAQLEASRIKANQSTINNLGSELIKRWETRFTNDRNKFNQFRETVASDNAARLLSEYKQQAMDAYNEWKSNPENSGKDITAWPRYKDYIKAVKLAEQRAKDLMYIDIAPIYGRTYVPRWKREDTVEFFNKGWE